MVAYYSCIYAILCHSQLLAVDAAGKTYVRWSGHTSVNKITNVTISNSTATIPITEDTFQEIQLTAKNGPGNYCSYCACSCMSHVLCKCS